MPCTVKAEQVNAHLELAWRCGGDNYFWSSYLMVVDKLEVVELSLRKSVVWKSSKNQRNNNNKQPSEKLKLSILNPHPPPEPRINWKRRVTKGLLSFDCCLFVCLFAYLLCLRGEFSGPHELSYSLWRTTSCSPSAKPVPNVLDEDRVQTQALNNTREQSTEVAKTNFFIQRTKRRKEEKAVCSIFGLRFDNLGLDCTHWKEAEDYLPRICLPNSTIISHGPSPTPTTIMDRG